MNDGLRSSAEVDQRIRPTRLESALDWASALAPSPFRFGTGCCGVSPGAAAGHLYEAFGSAPPAMSARSADLLIVAGSLTRQQIPLLETIYERMLAPRWVVAWGECAISGGPYQNYATVSGVSRILPVDVVVRGCPPAPEAFREALESLRNGAGPRADGVPTSSDDLGWPIRRPYEVNADQLSEREPFGSARSIAEGN